MPGTGDHLFADHALGERPPGMRTDAIHRENPLAGAEYGNDLTIDDELAAFVQRQIFESTNAFTSGHEYALSIGVWPYDASGLLYAAVFADFRTRGSLFQRRCTQKYCSGA